MAASAPTAAPRGRRPGQLTGGRHGLTVEQVRASQCERIVRAMTAAVGEHGYHGVRVSDIVARAGVSRKTFYELFAGKDDCFATTYGVWIDCLLGTTVHAFEGEREWVDRLRAGVTALLDALAQEPDAARLCFCEVTAVGGPTQHRREQTMHAVAELFDAPGVPSGLLGETLRAGRASDLGETLRREISIGRTAQLPTLAPQLMYALTLPLLGRDIARRELERDHSGDGPT